MVVFPVRAVSRFFRVLVHADFAFLKTEKTVLRRKCRRAFDGRGGFALFFLYIFPLCFFGSFRLTGFFALPAQVLASLTSFCSPACGFVLLLWLWLYIRRRFPFTPARVFARLFVTARRGSGISVIKFSRFDLWRVVLAFDVIIIAL